MHYGEQIKTVFEKEIAALENVKDTIDENIDDIISVLCNCKGKVVFSGIGKSGHISAKNASTFSSLGTPSIFMHPAEAKHGDLGLLDSNDVVVLVSYSGESHEITDLLPYIKLKSITTIAITGNNNSTLYRECDFAYCFPEIQEATRYGLAPTSSTTSLLVLGDALAIVLAEQKGFQKEDFATLHPGGVLGKCV